MNKLMRERMKDTEHKYGHIPFPPSRCLRIGFSKPAKIIVEFNEAPSELLPVFHLEVIAKTIVDQPGPHARFIKFDVKGFIALAICICFCIVVGVADTRLYPNEY